MKRRPGITLIEVLVAIFIMAIGLLALLTLFPLGALRMSQALMYDRAASAASEGANICDAFNIRKDGQYDSALLASGKPAPSLFITPPLFPVSSTIPTVPTGPFAYASQSGGGIPIFIDPYGCLTNGGATNSTPLGFSGLTTPQTPGIWRLSPSANVLPANIQEPTSASAQAASVAARYFTLLDDMNFFTNGLADTSSGVLQRGDRYTWGYLLHRLPPYATDGQVDLQVVVYAGRATALSGGEATFWAPPDGANSPPQFNAVGLTSIVIQVQAGQATPTIRRGSWILDTSYDDGSNISANQGNRPPTFSVHGDFYRVLSVSPSPTNANQLILELQTPLSKQSGISAVTVMDNVVEVFERGIGQSNNWEFHTQP
jgi:prepilin-type N-terminal cleavage/methylation domain-containing protein